MFRYTARTRGRGTDSRARAARRSQVSGKNLIKVYPERETHTQGEEQAHMTFALRIFWSSSTNPLHEMWTRKIEERGSKIRGRHMYMVP